MPSLTPSQLSRLRQSNTVTTSGWNPKGTLLENGYRIQPIYDEVGAGGDAQSMTSTLVGYIGYPDGETQKGKPYDIYSTDGVFVGRGVFLALNAMKDFAMFVVAAVAMYFGIPIMMGEGAAVAGGGSLAALGGTSESIAVGVGESLAAGESLVVGESLAGPVLSKAALDGTTIFGANSVAGAFDISAWTASLGATAATSTATTTASAGGLGSALQSVGGAAGSLSRIVGAASALFGLGGANAGQGGGLMYAPGTVPAQQVQAAPGLLNDPVFLILGAVALYLIVSD